MPVNFTRMNQDPKDTNEKDVPMHDDIRRLAISMRVILRRKYPDEAERARVSARIMREVQAA
jgi:hypothetical protein